MSINAVFVKCLLMNHMYVKNVKWLFLVKIVSVNGYNKKEVINAHYVPIELLILNLFLSSLFNKEINYLLSV